MFMKRSSLPRAFAALVASVAAVGSAHATTVTFDLIGSLPTQTYRYTVHNDTLGVPISDFAVFFPAENAPEFADYTLDSAVTPPGWTMSLVPGSAIDLGAYGEAYVLTSGEIPVGGSLGVFEITFTYSGVGTPGSQMFKIFDASTFDVLETGYTVRESHGVPDGGSTLGCTLVAVALLAGLGSRKR